MFTFYEVGGKVRDEILGLKSNDIDYVAVATKIEDKTAEQIFESLVLFLKEQNYQIFLVTPDMYTIRAKFPIGHKHEGTTADFVMARKEIGYIPGTRKPILVPGTLEDDLQRRDFTINAIAKSEDGVYIDPHGGSFDISMRILRTPKDAVITFNDDPLRLLRAIRFMITKKFRLNNDIQEILESFDYENKFNIISEERIREELYKCFNFDTLKTIQTLNYFRNLRDYIFNNTKLWLKPTNEK